MNISTRSAVSGRHVRALIAVGALVAGCGGDDDVAQGDAATTSVAAAEPSTTAAPSTAPPAADPPATSSSATDPPSTDPPATDPPVTDPPATDPPAEELPETPASVPVDQAYDFSGAAPDPDLLPARPGEVTARWYRAGSVYAVVYDGLDPSAPACPGNSAQTTAGFDFVSNAALPGMSCEAFPTAIESSTTQGVQICGDRVAYLTLIPSDYVAVLYASIERPLDGGGGVGVTSFVLVEDPMTLPEIDPTALAC